MQYMKKNAGLFLLVAFMLVLNGCASMGSRSDSPPPMENLPPLSNFVGEYRDIELPIDMKYNHKKSMVVRTDSFTGGVFYFSGKVERDSLKNFILASMQKNKWKRAGEVSYDSVLLAFTKPNKSCTVVLEEGFGGSLGSTYAAVYVAEDVSAGSGGN
ncbi:MAG: hypothetical protein KKB91_04620 [Proteobacteria bacterium]|nr:hypothetical protein [Desulfocapsa sp.]MBU3944208.1 hypothetical protein [Pseudomonadota bacterium]MCG2743813.1 hypothetical protein [Desulfobacteraceae bacterium]MBU3981941.1 hypothetical protein [Pseudomonadota bacterium]MBU4028809.1 hypothetical protein [Pseudomonadota bacterium]